MQHEAPIACTLPSDEMRARRNELAAGLMRKVAGVEELADGYALRFEAAPGIAEELGRFIEYERACCGFLRFALRVDTTVRLELTGPGATKDFLRPLLEELGQR
jgi:hypothetical protein